MANQYKASSAEIRRPPDTQLIKIIEYANPELILPKMIQQFFLEIGFADLYPHFKTIRIGAVHPFALLLFQDVQGQQLDLSVFPSITVSDSSDSEVFDDLSRGFQSYQLNQEQLAKLLGSVDSGDLIMSSTNRARLESAVQGGATVNATTRDFRANHNIDLNIWSENKDLTSILFDMVKHFVISNTDKLHASGIDVFEGVSGRRSGDINVEFGRILYGANVQMRAVIHTTSMTIDLPYTDIKYITPRGDYDHG